MESSNADASSIDNSDFSPGNHVPLLRHESAEEQPRSKASWFRSYSLPKNSGSSSQAGKSGQSAWTKGFQSWSSSPKDSQGVSSRTGLNFFNNIAFAKLAPVKIPVVEAPTEITSDTMSSPQGGSLNTFTKGFLSTSRNAVKAVQTKARHMVSQNKRRYQEGGFDLDMAYITENIIAMGFPAGDMSSGLLGYVEGFYRNHMEEVIKFFETQHKGKYKVYNLCSERLYDASLFEGKVACFPFDDHNCPQLHMIPAFCQSAYAWLKGDLENVVVVHCKAGMARTGLMICCLLLYLKFFPTSEESISYYNQKRCVDGKGLVLPSQLRYVKYFERVLRDFDGETPTGRKCILRGIRLHRCPYWIRPSVLVSDHNGVIFSTKKHPRTRDMMPEDIWFPAPRKGVMVFALPGERCIADVCGDFRVQFQDRHGDFYCWFNTNMMETRQVLGSTDLDGFEKRRLPSPGFQVEVVILDHDAPLPSKPRVDQPFTLSANVHAAPLPKVEDNLAESKMPSESIHVDRPEEEPEKDNIFSDSDGEDDVQEVRAPREVVQNSESREEQTAASTAGEGSTVLNSPSSTFNMASTIDGIRNAMDRMGIPQVGWAAVVNNTKPVSRPSSPPLTAEDPPASAKKREEVTLNDGVKSMPPTRVANPLMDKLESLQQGHGGEKASGRFEGGDLTRAGMNSDSQISNEVPVGLSFGLDITRTDQQDSIEERLRLDSHVAPSDFKAIAADTSVFTFGDEEDYYSEEE